MANIVKQVKVKVPGSAGNLGAGFDTLGLALSLYSRVTFTLYDRAPVDMPLLKYTGPGAQTTPPKSLGDLVYSLLTEMWRGDKSVLQHLRIAVDSDIPLNAGLGGTSAAIAAALWAANVMHDRVPTQDELLREAASIEGHSETLAASFLGGFVICARALNGSGFVTRGHNWPQRWKTLVVVPPMRQETKWSRSLLPKKISFEDAVFNIQRVAMLVSAVADEDDKRLVEALSDRLHEPYRAERLPHFLELRKLVEYEALGTVLSGAGPAVLVLVHERRHNEVKQMLLSWAEGKGPQYAVLDVDVDRQGIQEVTPDLV